MLKDSEEKLQSANREYEAGKKAYEDEIAAARQKLDEGWQEYNAGGMFSQQTREGDRYGGGLYAGYAHMLAPHLNLEFGVGMWAGADVFTVYSCPSCGLTLKSGVKGFVLPDDIMLALVYVF